MQIDEFYINPAHISYVILGDKVVEINFAAKHIKIQMNTTSRAKKLFDFVVGHTRWWSFLLRDKF